MLHYYLGLSQLFRKKEKSVDISWFMHGAHIPSVNKGFSRLCRTDEYFLNPCSLCFYTIVLSLSLSLCLSL